MNRKEWHRAVQMIWMSSVNTRNWVGVAMVLVSLGLLPVGGAILLVLGDSLE